MGVLTIPLHSTFTITLTSHCGAFRLQLLQGCFDIANTDGYDKFLGNPFMWEHAISPNFQGDDWIMKAGSVLLYSAETLSTQVLSGLMANLRFFLTERRVMAQGDFRYYWSYTFEIASFSWL
jgi:hypothetical protein